MTRQRKGANVGRELKVYAVAGFRSGARGQTREIVAARSWAEAHRCLVAHGHIGSMYDFRKFGGVTGNADDIAVATSEPGTVFWRPLDSRGDWNHAAPTDE